MKAISAAVALVCIGIAPYAALARNSGVSTFDFGAGGCNECHSGGNEPVVVISGPEFVRPLSTHEFRVRISPPSNGLQSLGGFHAAAPQGTLFAGGKYDSLTTTMIGEGGTTEVTHSSRKGPSGRTVNFSFLWQAPASFSNVTLTAWGNAVNGDLSNTGDRAAQATFAVLDGELGLCPPAPISCTTPGKSTFVFNDSLDDAKDAVSFQWSKGPAVGAADFGDPTTSSDFALCIYRDSALISELDIPSATTCDTKACWSISGDPLAPKGYKYKNKAGAPTGVRSAKLSAGLAGKSKLQVKAKGIDLPDLALAPVGAATVTVQLINTATAICFGDVYSGAEISKDEPAKFKAKADNL
ncbi:MAG TPA: choice-of-anchor V domain-containing protein [Terriglobales bacterium]|nr:choice-of-anchor V domain-containing protein [Terriglobales bacterium]